MQKFMHSQDRHVSIHTTVLTEGSEAAKFKSYFKDWPQNAAPSLYIEGRGKVAGCIIFYCILYILYSINFINSSEEWHALLVYDIAIFKYQGYDVKEIPEDDYQPIIDSHGILSVTYKISFQVFFFNFFCSGSHRHWINFCLGLAG